MASEPKVAGVLLAGGRGRRLGGGDKCLRQLGGRTLLQRAIERARPQVSVLLLNANGDPARFAAAGLPVVADPLSGHPGPLAGVLAGLEWAAGREPALGWVASFATDAPFFPADLVGRLMAAAEAEGAEIALAASGGRTHPVFALWPVSRAGDLRRALVEEGVRKVDAWAQRYRVAEVAWALGAADPFFNVNAPEDLAEAERLLAPAGREP